MVTVLKAVLASNFDIRIRGRHPALRECTMAASQRLFQAAYVNSLGVLCQKLLRFLEYKYVYSITKEHLYSGEIVFHVESQVFEKAKSLKSSEDKFR